VFAGKVGRRTAAFIDAVLDLVYVTTYLSLSMMSNVHPTQMFPTNPIGYLGIVSHPFTVAHAASC